MMGRTIKASRLIEPTEDDLTWAATQFEERMRFIQYSGSIALQMHSTNEEAHRRLVERFGGAAYNIPGTKTFRWRIARDVMLTFLQGIEPFLQMEGRLRVSKLLETLQRERTAAAQKHAVRDVALLEAHAAAEEQEAEEKAE